MSELKPCPFCGRTKYLKVHRRKCRDFPDGMFAIKCTRCGIRGRYQLTEERAVDAWNERADDAWNTRNERICHDTGVRYPGWTCSECGSEQMHAPHFCPDCGAKVVQE